MPRLRLPKIRRPNISSTQFTSYVLFALSIVILAMAAYMNFRIDVLSDWRLELPKDDIHIGDVIVVESIYKKELDVSGKSTRYIECKNERGIFIRYPISEATANRSSGKNGTGIIMKIPNSIPDAPVTCRINVTIDYEIMAWRHVIESQNSKTFTLYPALEEDSEETKDEQESEKQKTSQTESPTARPYDVVLVTPQTESSSSSYSQNTPDEEFNQRDISQGENLIVNEQRTLPSNPIQPRPTLLETLDHNLVQPLLTPIKNLIGGY